MLVVAPGMKAAAAAPVEPPAAEVGAESPKPVIRGFVVDAVASDVDDTVLESDALPR